MRTLGRDLRHAVRMLARQPAFTAVAVGTLALGIGATTAIFTVVDAVLLRPLPFPEPHRLVQLWETFRPAGQSAFGLGTVSMPNLRDWREQSDAFAGLAAYAPASFSLQEADGPVRAPGAVVSAEFFDVLGVPPRLGRVFGAPEEAAGQRQLVVLSDGLWRRSFGADPAIVGGKIALDGQEHTVLGVMPPGIRHPSRLTDLWAPLVIDAATRESRGNHWLRVVGRLRPGISLERAQQQTSAVAARVSTANPDTSPGRGVRLVPLHEQLVQNARPALLVLLGAVAFVLLICCFNVANLLLARAAARQRETAIRIAIGAGALRLARQFLVEGLVLALLGGAAGVAVAWVGLDVLLASVADFVPRVHEVRLDLRVLALTLSAALATGVAFGLAPALGALRLGVFELLKEGGRTAPAATGRSLLVAGQVAITTVLLVAAGLMLRSFGRLLDVETGLRTADVLTARLSLSAARYPGASAVGGFHRRLIERIAGVPGVEAAGLISHLPLQSAGFNGGVVPEGQTFPRGHEPLAEYRVVTPGYFRALGVPLLGGRALSTDDAESQTFVALVNQTLARRFWPGQDPVGRRLRFEDGRQVTVAGVVGDVRQVALAQDTSAEVYLPPHAVWVQDMRTASLVVRASRGTGDLMAAIRQQVTSLDPTQPLYDAKTMDHVIADSISDRRLNLVLLGSFATVAVLLAALGVYGVISYTVTGSTREIGIRMSLGAQQPDIFRLVVGQGLILAGLGLTVGIAGALALTRLMSGLLFAVGAQDPATFVAVPVFVFAVALAACALPARRAMRVDPAVALRAE